MHHLRRRDLAQPLARNGTEASKPCLDLFIITLDRLLDLRILRPVELAVGQKIQRILRETPRGQIRLGNALETLLVGVAKAELLDQIFASTGIDHGIDQIQRGQLQINLSESLVRVPGLTVNSRNNRCAGEIEVRRLALSVGHAGRGASGI